MRDTAAVTVDGTAAAVSDGRKETLVDGARICVPKGGARLVFSDLDGTLLDRKDYSWSGALPGLEALAETGTPLILVTSKTRVEVEALLPLLRVHDPFVFENGGGVYVPREFDPTLLSIDPSAAPSRRVESRGGGYVTSWGGQYFKLRSFLAGRAERYGLTGFGDLSVNELAVWTGLSLDAARRAQRREFTEPFRLDCEDRLGALQDEAAAAGLSIVRGGRFFHLQAAGATKGRAVRTLIQAYSMLWGTKPQTLALGDADNDIPMLTEVDRAVWLGAAGSAVVETLGAAVRRPKASGPAAWSREVSSFLSESLSGEKHV